MFFGAAICGIGHSIAKLCVDIGISKLSNNNNGVIMGIFSTISSSSTFLGNLISLIVLLCGYSRENMLWIMSIPTGVGMIMSIFISFVFRRSIQYNILPNDQSKTTDAVMVDLPTQIKLSEENIGLLVKETSDENTRLINKPDQRNIFDHIKEVLVISSKYQVKGYYLIPLMIDQSIQLNVIYLILPKLLLINSNNIGHIILDNVVSSEVFIYNVSMFISMGLASIIFGIISGKTFDKYGWALVVYPYVFLELFCLSSILLVTKVFPNGSLYLWIIIGFGFGILNSTVNNILYITITRTYKSSSNQMVAFYQLVLALSFIIFSLYVNYISYEYVLLINGIISVISGISYHFRSRLCYSLESISMSNKVSTGSNSLGSI